MLEDAAQIPAHRLAQDVAIEKILAALAATGEPARDFLTCGPPQVPTAHACDGRRGESALECDHHAGVRIGKGALAQVSHTVH